MKEEVTRNFFSMPTENVNNVCSVEETETPCAFVKNGNIIVQHNPDGPYPVVIPSPGIKLIVNGQELRESTPVTMQDAVRIDIDDERREGEWTVTISSDGLQAILRIRPTLVIHREAKDCPPTRKLQLEIAEREECFPVLSLNELLQKLSRLGINYGIDWQACSRAVTSCIEEEIVIAQGTPAKPGKDGWVELLFASDSKLAVLVGEEEKIDFRKRYIFTSVTEGEILAVKHSPKLGLPGTGVKGDVIVPPVPKEIYLSAGEGVVLTKDKKRAIATRAGRPVAYHGHNLVRVSVLPELVHSGNVDLSSGNIAFKGDVVITGDVEAGIVVEAGGNVRIDGLVSGVQIQATGSVLVKGNILTSTVTAGGTPAYMQELLPQVRTLSIGLREMIMAIYQLLGHSAFKQGDLKNGIGPLLKLLLEGKFHHLLTTAEAFRKQIDTLPSGLVGEGLDGFIKEIEQVVVYSPLHVRDLQEIEKLANRVSEWEQTFASSPTTKSDVLASNILNSTVIASGDIKVLGGGCYNSRIQADKKVTVVGVFRGGEIQAGEDVYVGELGSKGGSATRVMAGPRATVTIKTAFENALVLVGSRAYRFNGKEKDVRLSLDKEGNLQSRTIPA
ncbi:MAG: DUF342 domain-containing protein [Bacillota bacterium]